MTATRMPTGGDIVAISGRSPIGAGLLVRVVKAETFGSTPVGCVHLQAYVLDTNWQATQRRSLFLNLDHITIVPPRVNATARRVVKAAARNTGPALIPKQRPASEPMTPGRTR